MSKLTLHHEIDLAQLQRSIDTALSLNDNEAVFTGLTGIVKAKADITALLDQVESIERETKQAINAKAKALYGDDWQTIAGQGYKITRSYAGAVYNRIEGEKVAKKFLKVVESLDTAAINAYLEENEALPTGLELNNQRTEVIKVTLK